MSRIEKIQQYTKKTKIPPVVNGRYCMRFDEACALYEVAGEDRMDAISLAFSFGIEKYLVNLLTCNALPAILSLRVTGGGDNRGEKPC